MGINLKFIRNPRNGNIMKLSDFNYDLPEELIAQSPCDKRDECRLLMLDKESGDIRHGHFFDIENELKEGDVLVLNNSRVIPARLFAKRKDTDADVEVFLIRPMAKDRWECMVRPGKKAKRGKELYIGDIDLKIEEEMENGNREISFECEGNLEEKLRAAGQIPLPPYIREELDDPEKYQTVYAKFDGSVAAPTAGLHFTDELLERIKNKGVEVCFVTLHVGIGTFRPVKTENILEHKMHSEYYIFPQETAEILNRAKSENRRIIAVGTTACRVLETVGKKADGELLGYSCGETEIFIYPGYKFSLVNALITNFHLPESTLIMLVSALAGRENVLNAYDVAVKEKYRFFSFGDAMFIS